MQADTASVRERIQDLKKQGVTAAIVHPDAIEAVEELVAEKKEDQRKLEWVSPSRQVRRAAERAQKQARVDMILSPRAGAKRRLRRQIARKSRQRNRR